MKRFIVPRVAHCSDGCIRKGARLTALPPFLFYLLTEWAVVCYI